MTIQRAAAFSRRTLMFFALAAALVVLRSLVWIAWEQSHFDSDQAIVGLMAKHAAEFRAFPLVFYGQHYMLAVEAWLAAPIVALAGATVWAVKLPLLAINLTVVWLLLRILVRDVGLTPAAAFAASLFFVAAPPITASRLVEAQGGNIEPFLYVLLLWILRTRPVAFGLVAGIGIMNREFTAYAVVALLAIEVAIAAPRGRYFTRANARGKAIVFGEIAGVTLLVRLLKARADILGPGTAGTLPASELNGQVTFWTSRFCVDPGAAGSNLRWLFHENLPTLFGWRIDRLDDYVRSTLTVGHPWSAYALVVVGLAAFAGLVLRAARRIEAREASVPAAAPATVGGHIFPIYLVCVGLIATGVYALTSCAVQDRMLIRYTLLALFVPTGALAWTLAQPRASMAKGLAIAAAVVWASSSTVDNARVLAEYLTRPPADEYRNFADFLERQGVRYGEAPYWTAYHVDFLTQERLTIGSNQKVRITEYEDIVGRHDHEWTSIFVDDPCTDEGAVRFRRWCLLYFNRARGVNTHP